MREEHEQVRRKYRDVRKGRTMEIFNVKNVYDLYTQLPIRQQKIIIAEKSIRTFVFFSSLSK